MIYHFEGAVQISNKLWKKKDIVEASDQGPEFKRVFLKRVWPFFELKTVFPPFLSISFYLGRIPHDPNPK